MRLLGLSLLALAGCTGVDRNVEPRVTITAGIYGQTTIRNDEGYDTSPKYLTMDVSLLRLDGTPVASVTSGEQGFYELAAEPADYQLCTSHPRCTNLTLVAEQRVRCDWESGVAARWSCSVKP